MSSFVSLDTRPDGVAVLTFDQPGSRANVFTEPALAEFEAAVDALADRDDVRGLVLASAKPGVFVAGADLKLFGNAPGPNDPKVRAFIEQGLRVAAKLEALPFPTCAAIDGAALGGGLEMALACDYRVCGTHPRVELGLPEVKMGLIPGWGGTQRLPRVVGLEVAAEIIATGRSLDADRAYQHDLTSDRIRSEELVAAAARLLLGLRPAGWSERSRERRQRPVPESDRQAFHPAVPDGSSAAREALVVITRGAELSLAESLKLETEAFMRLAGSDESKRLIAEFFASRKK